MERRRQEYYIRLRFVHTSSLERTHHTQSSAVQLRFNIVIYLCLVFSFDIKPRDLRMNQSACFKRSLSVDESVMLRENTKNNGSVAGYLTYNRDNLPVFFNACPLSMHL